MRINQLLSLQRDELRKAYKTTKSPYEKPRYHALWLVSGGGKHKDVCGIVDIKEKTLLRWIALYKKGGIGALRDRPQPGNNRVLSREQKNEIKGVLEKKTPEDMGYKGPFWNVETLRHLVRDRFQVTYKTSDSYRRLFHDCGFTFHKPEKVNRKQNPHMRKRFEENLKKNSKNTGEKIVWYW
jgi:transposase